MQVSIYGPGSGSDGLELFEDEDLRTLYEQLPDLKSVLPAVLFADPKEGKADSGSGEEIEQLLTRLPVASTREQVDSLASELVCAGGRFHVRCRLTRHLEGCVKGREGGGEWCIGSHEMMQFHRSDVNEFQRWV